MSKLRISMLLRVILAMLTFLPAMAMAEPDAKKNSGEAELGGSASSGNTGASTLNGRLALAIAMNDWSHAAIATFYHTASDSNQDDETQRFTTDVKSNYHMSDRSYMTVSLAYDQDRSSGYRYNMDESIGYGRYLVKSENVTLKIDAGPGFRQRQADGKVAIQETVFRIETGFVLRLSDKSSFTETVTLVSGADGTITESKTSFKALLWAELAMKFGLDVRNNSQPPIGIVPTDTLTTISLVYGF